MYQYVSLVNKHTALVIPAAPPRLTRRSHMSVPRFGPSRFLRPARKSFRKSSPALTGFPPPARLLIGPHSVGPRCSLSRSACCSRTVAPARRRARRPFWVPVATTGFCGDSRACGARLPRKRCCWCRCHGNWPEEGGPLLL